eukprot:m.78187 g.78187  ORF g.78187 m.78187 type:complete len:112 (+) comp12661_c0_seq3:3917-4252(+)
MFLTCSKFPVELEPFQLPSNNSAYTKPMREAIFHISLPVTFTSNKVCYCCYVRAMPVGRLINEIVFFEAGVCCLSMYQLHQASIREKYEIHPMHCLSATCVGLKNRCEIQT